MNHQCTFLTVAVLITGLAGCQGLAPPSVLHPGPAEYQQRRAQRFDPYPENEPGPEIVGARPLEYGKPPAEVQRARWSPWNTGRR